VFAGGTTFILFSAHNIVPIEDWTAGALGVAEAIVETEENEIAECIGLAD